MHRHVPALCAFLLAACGSDSGSPGALASGKIDQAISDYKQLVNLNYGDVLAGAQALQVAVDAFVTNPTEATHAAAKQAWLTARLPYAPSEAFRFYDGPIDNPQTGPEGLINSWPLDENYIDYTRDDPQAGIINDLTGVPTITASAIEQANTVKGEKAISTGFHAIEFLLWGQDDVTPGLGAGKRPYTDYVTGPGGTAQNQARRATYLKLATELVVTHLEAVAAAWLPSTPGNFASTFGSSASDGSDPKKAFAIDLLKSIGEMALSELGGQRMTVPYIDRDQEDEHSCFSDNTAPDLLGDGVGIQNVWLGRYGGFDGMGIDEVVAEVAPQLAQQATQHLSEAVAQLTVLVDLQNAGTPIDVVIASPDGSPGRVAMLGAIHTLQAVGGDMEQAAKALGLTVVIDRPKQSL